LPALLWTPHIRPPPPHPDFSPSPAPAPPFPGAQASQELSKEWTLMRAGTPGCPDVSLCVCVCVRVCVCTCVCVSVRMAGPAALAHGTEV